MYAHRCARAFLLAGLFVAFAQPAYAEADVVIKTSGVIEDLAVGGEGKFILVKIKGEESLSVYDPAAQKIARQLRLPTTEFVFAAGGETVLIYLKDDDQFQTWSLRTFEKIKSAANPKSMRIQQIVMGHAREDAALVFCSSGDRLGGGPSDIFLLDTATLTETKTQRQQAGMHRLDGGYGPHLRADRYLNRIAFWSPNVSPSGINLLTITDRGLEFRNNHSSAGYLAVGDDGNIYSGTGHVFGSEPVTNPQFGNAIPSRGQIEGHMLYPGLGGVFFLGVERDGKLSVFQSGRTTPSCAGGVFPEWTLPKPPRPPGFPERTGEPVPFPPHQEFTKSSFTLDKRIVFAPNLGYILFTPLTSDRLIHRKFDLKDLLDKSGKEYLLVTSSAPTRAKAGSQWQYPITALAKTGTLSYSLQAAPEGMKLTPEGLLTWKIPAGIQGRAPVKVRVTDGGEKELQHSFVLEFD